MQTDPRLIGQARRLLEQGDFSAAERAYRDLAEQVPKSRRPELELIIGACQQAQGRDQEAIATLEAAVAMDRSRAESWFQLGRARRQAGDQKGAAEALGQAIVLDPNHALARVELGRQALAAGDGEGAERHFRTALRANPDCVPAQVSLADRLLDTDQVDAAFEQASRAVQLRPQSAEAQLVMARAFDRRGHPDFAERCLDNALKAAPGHVGLNCARAKLLLARGRAQQALHAISEAREHGVDDPALLLVEAFGLQRLGRARDARSRLELVLRDHEHLLDGGALLALAELRLAGRDVGAAVELVDRLEAAWPAAGALIRAQLAEADGQRERAAEIAAGLHDQDNTHIRRQARLLSAHLALDRDDWQTAVTALEPLAKADSPDRFARWLMARALDAAGRHDEAAVHLASSAWRTPPQLLELEAQLDESLYSALASLSCSDWPSAPPDDDYPQPVFLVGWPGSGRDQLLAAVSEAAASHLLDRSDALRRREALDLPAGPEELAGLDEDRIRQARKRYFRAGSTGLDRPLEPLWLPFAALPAVARYFPGSTVMLIDADERDLELDWRFSGFHGIERLRSLLQREFGVLEHFIEHLPLDFEVLSLGDLQSDPAAAAAQIGQLLELDDTAALAAAIERHLASLRPAGHWQHYASLFADTPAA